MKNNSGNIIIFFAVLLIILSTLLLITLKQSLNIEDNSLSKTKPVQSERLGQPNSTFQTSIKLDEPSSSTPSNEYQYYNDIRFITSSEILNPFLASLNKNPHLSQPDIPKTPIKTHNSIPANQIMIAPNGFTLPTKTSYLAHYNQSKKNGNLNITINNIQGKSNILVFVYLNRLYAENSSMNKQQVLSAAYIAAGDSFKFSNLQSGYYQIEWLNLANKKLFQSNSFPIFQDNQFAYDRMFSFNQSPDINHEKAIELPLSTLYNQF